MGDYSRFHPTVTQTEILYTMSSQIANQLNVDEVLMRNLSIEAIIEFQKEFSQYHFETEKEVPLFRLARTQKISDYLTEKIHTMMIDPSGEDKKVVAMIIDRVMKHYLEAYAMR